VLALGKFRLSPIVERDVLPYPTSSLFGRALEPEMSVDSWWSAPRFYDRAGDALLASHHSWLIQSDTVTVLLDPCVGNHKDRPGLPAFHQLDLPWLGRLAATGVAPGQVDIVVSTHLHADHCGWNTTLTGGRWALTFPRAIHVFSRAERDHWSSDLSADGLPEALAYNRGVFADSVQPVIEVGRAVVIDGQAELADGLVAEPAPGHTPGHLKVTMTSGGTGVIFAGDAIHHPLQVRYPQLSSAGSWDHRQAYRTRLDILSDCADGRLLLAAAHFPAPHAFRVERDGDAFRLTGYPRNSR
jgi:glyoxylase-like metal-dependent hydrolase (beta-lactamase superfamily II)